ncbi:MAG: CysS/YqeB C-terminal domain-containing protein, partial [Candidatus Methylumidiphilus sp.]
VARDTELRPAEKLRLLLGFDRLFGLDLARDRKAGLEPEILAIISRREAARRAGDWATADALRAELLQCGIKIKDRADGTDWERV